VLVRVDVLRDPLRRRVAGLGYLLLRLDPQPKRIING